VCTRCLEKSPAARYDTAQDLADALRYCAIELTDGPIDTYRRLGLPKACTRWFRPDNRFEFHPAHQFVAIAADWETEGNTDDLVSDLVGKLRTTPHSRIAICGNYGQGKTFLAWKLALTLASTPDAHVPLFYPLRELTLGHGVDPVDKLLEYFIRRFPGLNVQDLIENDNCLLILDAADEIPASSQQVRSQLETILKTLDKTFPRLAIVLTFRTGLFPNHDERRRALSGYHIATLEPWNHHNWLNLLRLCWETKLVHFEDEGLTRDSSPSRPAWQVFHDTLSHRRSTLLDLIKRPLWCRMIIETRERVLDCDITTEADLYEFYVTDYFRQIEEDKKHVANWLSPDRKLRVMELLASTLVQCTGSTASLSDDIKVTDRELSKVCCAEFGIADSEFASYVTHEVRTYSLLNSTHISPAGVTVFGFGHISFRDFFQARAFVRLLKSQAPTDRVGVLEHIRELSTLCARVNNRFDLMAFIAGLLNKWDAAGALRIVLQSDPISAFGEPAAELRITLLQLWLYYSRVVSRDQRPDLCKFRLDRLGEVSSLDLSGCLLDNASLDLTRFVTCNLSDTSLQYASCRGAMFLNCQTTSDSFRGADLTGAVVLSTSETEASRIPSDTKSGSDHVMAELQRRLRDAIGTENYEEAARLRDNIAALAKP